MVKSCDGFVRLRKEIEDHDLVGAFVQPWAGNVEGLLWTNTPESAQVVTVDPGGTFPSLRVSRKVSPVAVSMKWAR